MDKEQAERDRLQYEFEALEKRIENDFTYHAPTAAKASEYELLRRDVRELAHKINRLVPGGREKSTALAKLEEAVMWANAGIARSAVMAVTGKPYAQEGGA